MNNSDLITDLVIFMYNRGFITDENVNLQEFAEKVPVEYKRVNPFVDTLVNNAKLLHVKLLLSQFVKSVDSSKGTCMFDLPKIMKHRKNMIEKLDMELQKKVKNSEMDELDLEPDMSLSLLKYMEKELIFQFSVRQPPLRISPPRCFYCPLDCKSYHDLWKHISTHVGLRKNLSLGNYEIREQQFIVKYIPSEKSFWRVSIEPLDDVECINIFAIYLIDQGKSYTKIQPPFKMGQDPQSFYIKNRFSNTNYEFPLIIIYQLGRSKYMEMHHFPKIQRAVIETLKIEDKLPDYFPSTAAKSMHEGKPAVYLQPLVSNYINKQQILTPDNICEVFSLLVEMEDWAAIKEYEKLAFKSVKILESKVAEMDDEYEYFFEVPRKREADPISQMLSVGDQVILKKLNENIEVSGTISRFIKDSVYFNVELALEVKKKYDISFMPQRLKIQYQHKALNFLRSHSHLKKRLFPLDVDCGVSSIKSESRLSFFNSSLAGNPEQSEAVQNIVANRNKDVPFVLFGPPGTGKTTVIVETLLQLSRNSNMEARILVAAGSNAACDEIAVRLVKQFNMDELRNHAMLRIYAKSCERNPINDHIRPVSNLIHGAQYYPSLASIYKYRIVIATLTVVGRLVHAGISEKHFTHVFIDECGSIMEPESLLAMCGILSPTSNLILAGDPKQLGPIIQCRKAASYGLERSLLERLLERNCYKVDSETMKYNKSIQMRLVRNFRSHPSILSLPNMLYYDNELKALASPETTSRGIGWPALPIKNFPVLFKSVNGAMQQVKKLPSYFNQEEIDMVMAYVMDLMFCGILDQKVEQEDIGIISPYKRQCNFLRKELDKRGWYNITTGSVETFQGQERPIIIASTVRSRVKTPGFLDNPKRLNVLLTRAQSLLIIVGNPRTLYRIGDWKCLIDYCVRNEAFVGNSNRFKTVKKVPNTDLAQAVAVSRSEPLVDHSDSDSDESSSNNFHEYLSKALNLQDN